MSFTDLLTVIFAKKEDLARFHDQLCLEHKDISFQSLKEALSREVEEPNTKRQSNDKGEHRREDHVAILAEFFFTFAK